MSEPLHINLAQVDTTAEKLDFIATNLREAETNADALAGMIPHDGLSGCVSKFGNDWDRARNELISKVEDLATVGRKIFETFTDADRKMAQGLEGS